MKSVDFCVRGIAAGLPLRLRPELMLPNNFHCPLSTGGRQITMPMHRYKTQIESPEAKCPRFALIRYRMRSRALRKLQMHTIAPKGYRKAQVGSYLSADALCHPKSSLKARARANGNGVEVGGRGERSKPWGAGIVIRKHYLRLSLVCGSIAWASLSQLPCPLRSPDQKQAAVLLLCKIKKDGNLAVFTKYLPHICQILHNHLLYRTT